MGSICSRNIVLEKKIENVLYKFKEEKLINQHILTKSNFLGEGEWRVFERFFDKAKIVSYVTILNINY